VAVAVAAAPAPARAAPRLRRASSRTSATRIPAPADPRRPLSTPPRILILTASIGEGHDLPARLLADALRARGAAVAIADSLAIVGWPVRDAFLESSGFHTAFGNWVFDIEYTIGQRIPVSR
jgi:hypothetical protein